MQKFNLFSMFNSNVDEEKAIELLKELVKIDSVNPSLVSGANGEKEIAEYIADWLKSLGLKTRVDEVAKCRFNTVGILEGTGEGKSLMLNTKSLSTETPWTYQKKQRSVKH